MQQIQNLIEPHPIPSPIAAPWYVMLAAPQQEIPTVGRLHELGLEMFAPVIRKRVATGRRGKNGHKVTRVIAKPMFPGYGFLRSLEANSPVPISASRAESLVWREREGVGIRGVRGFMKDESGNFIRLSHAAVHAVFRRQIEEQQTWIASQRGGRKASVWKSGDPVRIDEDGGVYAGMLATIDKVDSRDRIHVFLGAAKIRHTLPADMVVAA